MPETNLPEITSKIRRMAAMMLGVKPAEIEGKPLRAAGADSIDVVELIMTAENEFGVSIADIEASGVKSVDELAELIAQKLGVG